MRACGPSLLLLLLAAGVLQDQDVAGATNSTHTLSQSTACSLPWRAVFGTAQDDRIEAVIEAGAGDLIAVGYTGGLLGVENFWPVGNSLGFVRKLDSNGVLVWQRSFDTSGTDIVEAIAFAPDGRMFVAGRTTGAFDGQSNHGQLDLFVAVLSDEGEVLDLRQSGDERPQHPVAIVALSNETFVVAGYDDIWVWGNAVMDWRNAVAARFDVDAADKISETWSIRSNAPAHDMLTGAAASKDGSYDVFVSRYDGSDPAYGGGIFVDRLSASGSVIWESLVSDFPFDFIAGIAISDMNRLYAAGTTFAASTTDGQSLGGSDGFVVEFDAATGSRKWARPIGSTESDWISSFSIDHNENLVLAGISEGVVAPEHIVFQDDPFALILSPEGNSIGGWQGTREPLSDETYSVAVGCGDSFAFAGSLTGILPSATLGRTDAELTIVPFARFETIMSSWFDPTD